ncbi:MAG: hypothetical protein IT261_04585 [Saprospiraceae bacterium]|nr:hypothetical protein [Saprospiraceae bacterium]
MASLNHSPPGAQGRFALLPKLFLKNLPQNVLKKNILFIFVSQFDTKTTTNLI